MKQEEHMLQVDKALIHLDIIYKYFICDICKCKGVCCIEGDSGAPLEKEEAQVIERIIPIVFHRLTPEAQKAVKNKGGSVVDFENELTTTTINTTGPCVFTQYDKNNNAYCVLEKAFEEGLTDFQKPISCHLYPIRIKKYESFTAVNYHQWSICKDAVLLGNKKSVPVYEFLKAPLLRFFGKDWYEELCIAAEELKKHPQSF